MTKATKHLSKIQSYGWTICKAAAWLRLHFYLYEQARYRQKQALVRVASYVTVSEVFADKWGMSDPPHLRASH